MREANKSFGEDSLFGSDQGDMYQDMFDDQMAMQLSKGKGLGLADMLIKQLAGTACDTGSAVRLRSRSASGPDSLVQGRFPAHAAPARRTSRARARRRSQRAAGASRARDRLGHVRAVQRAGRVQLQPVRHQGRQSVVGRDGQRADAGIRIRHSRAQGRALPRLRLAGGQLPRLRRADRRQLALCQCPRRRRQRRGVRDSVAAGRLRDRPALRAEDRCRRQTKSALAPTRSSSPRLRRQLRTG